MAEDKSVVYNVRIEYGDLIKNQEDIGKRIDELKEKQLNLDTSTKANRDAFKDNAQQLKALEQQQKLNTKVLGELTTAEKQNTDTTNFNNNSIAQNRDLLKTLNAEYIRLANPTKEQTARLKSLTDTLKAQESAIGDNRRNVGNYSESFKGLIGQFPALQNGLTGIGNGFKALSAGNPFTLILMALTPLIQSFMKLEPVTNAINGVFEGISSSITTIVVSIKGFVESISSGQGIFSAFTDNFGNLGKNIAEASKEGYNLVQALDDLEDAERANQAISAQTNRDVAILIAQSRDRSKTERERIALLERANVLEEAQLKRDEILAFRREALAAQELARAIRLGKDRDTAEQNLADAQSARFAIQQSAGSQIEKSQGRINTLVEAENTIREKASEKRQKETDRRKAETEKEAERVKKAIEDATKFFNDTTNAEFEFTKNATAIFYEQQQEALKEKYAQDLITEQEFNAQSLALEQEQLIAEGIIYQDYAGTIKGLDDEIARNAIAQQTIVTDNQIEQNKKQKEIADKKAKEDNDRRLNELKGLQAFTESTSQTFFETLTAQGDYLKNFQKALGGVILDILEKQLIAQVTAGSLGTPDSILSGGITGAIRAGILVGLVKTAFSIGRNALAKFADGGLVENIDGFASGGLSGTLITSKMGKPIRRSNGDNLLATVKTGEVILNQRQQNALGGSNTFRKIGVPGFANGGMIPSVPLDTNTALIESLRNMQLVVSVSEITSVQNRLKTIEESTSL
jgi:hypothetical protein